MQIRQKIDEEVAVSYQEKLDVAKTYEEAGNLNGAVAEYQKAANLKQGDDSVPEKIASLEEQIKQEEQVKQAQAARKDSIDKQLLAASLKTVGTASNALEAETNQSVSVSKSSGDTVTNENQNLAEQAQIASAESSAQTVKTEPDFNEQKAHHDSAQKVTVGNEEQETLAKPETGHPQNIEQEKVQTSLVEGEDKSSVEASIKQNNNISDSGILLIFGLILFALLVVLWFRKKAKQKDTAENE
jgi:hypothetical protein